MIRKGGNMTKKYLPIIALAVMAVGLMCTYAFALVLDTKTIPVNATVAKYAKVTPLTGPLDAGAFGGWADQVIPDGTGTFRVETNTPLNLQFAYSIAHETLGTPLITYLKVSRSAPWAWLTQPDDTFVLSPVAFSNAQAGKTIREYAVTIKTKTGAISAQAAGTYTGAITLTVSAH